MESVTSVEIKFLRPSEHSIMTMIIDVVLHPAEGVVSVGEDTCASIATLAWVISKTT